jgi:hypothetical protein
VIRKGIAKVLPPLPTDAARHRNLAEIWARNHALLTDGYFDQFTLSQKVRGFNEGISGDDHSSSGRS